MGELVPGFPKNFFRLGVPLVLEEILAVGRHEHGGELGRGQPAFHMIEKILRRIQDVDVRGPDDPELFHLVLVLVDVELYRHEKHVDGSGHGQIGVRHGTQLGAAVSSVFEKVQQDGFFLLFGAFERSLIR